MGFWATFTRELRAYFFSPLAYVVLFLVLVVNGYLFASLVSYMSDPRAVGGGPPLAEFFRSSWLLLIILGAVLTMRLISEELKSGSIEVLMTAPVSEGEVVAGKYLAALVFFSFLWAPTLAYGGMIAYWERIDWGPVAAGYLGIFLVGGLFLAIGTFASALSKSQLIAAILSFVTLLLLVLVPGILGNLINGESMKKVFEYMTIWDHLDEFDKGIVDTRRLVYYVSATIFFLVLASRSLEDRKWR